MANKLELLKQFKSLGINVQDDILHCAIDMCGRLFIDERELVETWLAYSLNNLSGAKPTVEYLLQMEQKEFSDKSLNTPKRMSGDLAVYDFHSSLKRKKDESCLSDDEVLTPTKKIHVETSNKSEPSQSTPSQTSKAGSSEVESPAPPIPINTPSSYSKRSNAGKVQLDYGKSSCSWVSKPMEINAKLYGANSDWMAMHSSLIEDSKILLDASKEIVELILTKNDLKFPELKGDAEKETVENNEDAIFAGRILKSESSKLNLANVQMESIDGGTLDVDMSELSNYSLFPGQVIVCTGPKIGKKVIAKRIFSNASLPLPEYTTSKTDPLQIIVAAGPFSQNDALTYEPLQDLIKHVKTQNPHLFVLMGPLVDSSHVIIKNGSMNETYSDFMKKIVKEIIDALKECQTKFFLVASSQDAFNQPIYPTPAPSVDNQYKDYLIPDPCIIDVNGFMLGLTSTDVLLHLSKNEISNCGDRLARLASHLITQQCFYPLYPAESDVGLDVNLWLKHSRFPVTPHALVTPSDLLNFIKEVNDVIVVNSGKLSKGLNGGHYACLEVQPPTDEKWSPSTHVAAKLIKI